MGNLVRHTLDLDSVGTPKSVALARKLTKVAPDVAARALYGNFSSGAGAELKEAVTESSLVVDCTASDDVIRELGQESWREEMAIVSLAVGYGASRLYVYASPGSQLDPQHFFDELSRWSTLDEAEARNGSEIREGRGCFDSVFPGRYEQIAGLVASGLRWIEGWLEREPREPKLLVLESLVDEEGSPLVRRALEPGL